MSKIIILSYLLLSFFTSNSQNLPKTQSTGLRAPTNIKIDGKLQEWGKVKAYNKNTQLFYSISNDDVNLYLAVYVEDPVIIKKIISGGVSLTIYKSNNNKNDGDITITYPYYDSVNKTFRVTMGERDEITRDVKKNSTKADSLMLALNKQLGSRLKFIKVDGVKAIKDGVISVYNEEGIKGAGIFDNKINYSSELAIPLKYLNIIDNSISKFSYKVALNGPAPANASVTLSGSGSFLIISVGGEILMTPGATQENYSLYYPTNFVGEYELVKK